MNTQLFLFTLAGNPITFNDDSASTTQSRITGTSVPGSGDYLLAVSGADRDPVSSAGAMWLDTPATTERAPDGPGAGGALTGWTGTGASGSYSIQLTGVCAAPAPTTPASPAAWGAATPNVVYGACTPPGNIGVSVYVVSGTSPASTGVSVTLDASAIGAGSIPLSGSGGPRTRCMRRDALGRSSSRRQLPAPLSRRRRSGSGFRWHCALHSH